MRDLRFVLVILTIVLSLAASSGHLYSEQDSLHIIDVVRLDPRFDKLVPFNLKVGKIAGRHKWVEGPVWQPRRRIPVLLHREWKTFVQCNYLDQNQTWGAGRIKPFHHLG